MTSCSCDPQCDPSRVRPIGAPGAQPRPGGNVSETGPEPSLGGFKAEYFTDLAALEETNFWFRARNELILWALKQYFPTFRTFMEIGCGTGYVLSGIASAFPSATLFGSDVFIEGLGFAAHRVQKAHYMVMDGRSFPCRQAFDVIGAFDVLEHIPEDEAVLSEMHRTLKPGGGLLLTVPQHPRLWSSVDEYACHVRRYTSVELRSKVERAGFEIVRTTSFVSTLLPAMLISRWRSKRDREFDPLDELRLPRTLNRTLEALLRAEQGWIRWGMSLPLGGSRLLIARRVSDRN